MYSLLFIIVLFILFYLIGLWALLIMIAFGLIDIWRREGTPHKNSIKSVLMVVQLAFFITLLHYSLLFGIAGYLTFIVVISLYKLWTRRDIYMDGVRSIEKIIWGSPAEERWKRKKLKKK